MAKSGLNVQTVKELAPTCTLPAQHQAVKIQDVSAQVARYCTKVAALIVTSAHATQKERATQLTQSSKMDATTGMRLEHDSN